MKPISRLRDLIDRWLKPPDVVPIKPGVSVAFWWVVRIALLWLLKGC